MDAYRKYKKRKAILLDEGMISKRELKRIAYLNGVPLFTQERDYIQTLFLFRLFSLKKSENLVFKGGTCLKFFYNSNRFSEDLDFTLKKDIEFESLLEKAASELSLVGIEAKIDKKKRMKDGFICRLRYKGPLFTGSPLSIGSIRIDISWRKDLFLKPEWKLLIPNYPDASPFSVLCMRIEEILAEKVRAVTTRRKVRDVYDIWFMKKLNVPFDKKLFLKKMKAIGKEVERKKIKIGKEEFKRELTPLLPSKINIKTVIREVNEFLLRNL